MTSFKSTIPLHENQKRFAQIPKLVRSLLLSDEVEAYWLVGHWSADRNVSGCQSRSSEPHASACVDYLEYSWFLVKRKQQISLSDWLIAATLLASQYEQHAFIIRLGGLTTLRSGRGDIQKILQSDERIQATWASLARLRASDTPYGYAAILKTRDADPEPGFTASGETPSDSAMWRTVPAVSSYAVRGDGDYHAIDFFLAVTGNISSKMHFAALGVSDILPNDKDSRSPWDYPTPAQLYAAKWIRGKCG